MQTPTGKAPLAYLANEPDMRVRLTLLITLSLLVGALATGWTDYQNERFGYRLTVPEGLNLISRAADGSGMIWQTGTVRLEVYGTNNPYELKPHEWFANVRASAGDKILEERQGTFEDGYWHEIFFLKKSRRVHRKTYIAKGSVNTLDISYGYRYRKQKYAIAQRVVSSFQPGDLTRGH